MSLKEKRSNKSGFSENLEWCITILDAYELISNWDLLHMQMNGEYEIHILFGYIESSDHFTYWVSELDLVSGSIADKPKPSSLLPKENPELHFPESIFFCHWKTIMQHLKLGEIESLLFSGHCRELSGKMNDLDKIKVIDQHLRIMQVSVHAGVVFSLFPVVVGDPGVSVWLL